MCAGPLERLASEKEFRRVYREGGRRSSPLVVIRYLPGDRGGVRLGVAVGRRFGSAVRRNRLRRRLREAVRALARRIAPGTEIVVTPRESAAEATFSELRGSVEQALGSAGLLGDQGEGAQ